MKKLDRNRDFGRVTPPWQAPEFDRPAHYAQDDRYFDKDDREIVPGKPLGATPVAITGSVLSPAEKSASTKERESLLKLVIGMAMRGYKWDPNQARNSATAEIRDDVLAVGLDIDDGTVLKLLRLAAELLPRNELSSGKAEFDRA